MKLANRIGAAVLATAMVGTLLTGCGGGSASTNASAGDGASSTESSGDGDNTYTMFMRSTYVDWIKEGWLYRHYERWRLQDGRDHEEVVRRGPDPTRMGRRYFR